MSASKGKSKSSKVAKAFGTHPDNWSWCKQCGISGPDVDYRSQRCAPCQGLPMPVEKTGKLAEYWNQRVLVQNQWIELQNSEGELEAAKENLEISQDDHLHACKKLARQIEKLGKH